MASRTVMNESAKCRSGREVDRVGRSLPSGRGGKMLHPFGNDEREAAESDRNVVVPPSKGATLVVVQTELPLQLFVDALGAPALLGEACDLLVGHPLRQGREAELR